MPTESEFLGAAQLFDDAGLEVSRVPGFIAGAFGPDVATGGQLTLEIDALIQQTTGACRADDKSLEELAATCRERAEIVAKYAAAMSAYHANSREHTYRYDRWLHKVEKWETDPSSNRHPGNRPNPPSRPNKPAAWVEI